MERKTKYSKIIANYLYNDMSQEERMQFEKDLLINEELSNEYELQSSAVKYLKARITLEEMESDPDLAAAEKLAEEILNEENEVSSSESRKRVIRLSNKKDIIRILAAAVILIGIVSTTLIISSGTNQSLYKSFYDPFDDTYLTYRGENDDIKASLRAGVSLYTQKNYIESSMEFKKIRENYPDDLLSGFYLGLSYMGNDDCQAAIEVFESHINSFDQYNPEVKWYLSLCYLNADSINQSYQLLQELTNYPGKYGEDSKKLAKKLKRKIEE